MFQKLDQRIKVENRRNNNGPHEKNASVFNTVAIIDPSKNSSSKMV